MYLGPGRCEGMAVSGWRHNFRFCSPEAHYVVVKGTSIISPLAIRLTVACITDLLPQSLAGAFIASGLLVISI